MIQAGGVPVLFVIAFGLVSLGAATRFAWSPGSGQIAPIAALASSVGFASIAGFASCLMTVAMTVSGNDEWANSPDAWRIVLQGIGESMSPLILGFSMVAVTSLITAVGLRRAPTR